MNTFDLTPLLHSTIGFDRTSQLLDRALEQFGDSAPSYPPYNIERLDENDYRLTLAVAGFGEDTLDITVKENRLTVKGISPNGKEDRTFLHRGIAGRTFERTFELADYIRVVDARLENGLLEIDLVRELPETMKPRTIAIGGKKAKRLGSKAA